MADKKQTVGEYPRWEALVEIMHANRPVEDIYLTGICAPDRPVASRLVAERAHQFIKSGNYTLGTQAVIRELLQEGEVPTLVASPANRQVQQRQTHSAKPSTPKQRQQSWGRTFKCPIVNLCSTKMTGTVRGTTVDLTDVVEEK